MYVDVTVQSLLLAVCRIDAPTTLPSLTRDRNPNQSVCVASNSPDPDHLDRNRVQRDLVESSLLALGVQNDHHRRVGVPSVGNARHNARYRVSVSNESLRRWLGSGIRARRRAGSQVA
jgi:hypothetical protein